MTEIPNALWGIIFVPELRLLRVGGTVVTEEQNESEHITTTLEGETSNSCVITE